MDITKFVKIDLKPIQKECILFTEKTRLWCQLPYPKHLSGCPNYGKKKLCPPNAPFMEKEISRYQYHYLVIAKFQFAQYKMAMKKLHPNWTNSQCACVLYWQSALKKRIKKFISQYYAPYKFILGCGSGFGKNICSMEAAGINVIITLKRLGIEIETKPRKMVHLICLIASNNALKKQVTF